MRSLSVQADHHEVKEEELVDVHAALEAAGERATKRPRLYSQLLAEDQQHVSIAAQRYIHQNGFFHSSGNGVGGGIGDGHGQQDDDGEEEDELFCRIVKAIN
jgi:hypothetical protein